MRSSVNLGTRPFFIWFALAYIAMGLLTTLLILYARSSSLLQADDGIVTFIVGLGMCVLLVIAFDAILRRSSAGKRLAVLTFTLLGLFAIFNAIALLQWSDAEPTQSGLLLSKVIVFGRIIASFGLAAVFGLSSNVHEYFAVQDEPAIADPPPPPTF